jgi:membrane-bound serine protease (ClpP class)
MRPARPLLAALLLLLVLAAGSLAQSPAGDVRVVELDGDVDPVSARFVEDRLDAAASAGSEAVVIRLDTPGGLVSSTREIVEAMGASAVPVAVWVGPSGARAGSAGAYISAASDHLGMAPGTNIGSATPITSAGEDLGAKVVNDAAAGIAAQAEARGRNAGAYRRMVTDSLNLTASEALDRDVIDTVQPTLDGFVAWLDGRPARDGGTIDTAGATVRTQTLGWWERVLQVVSRPDVVFLLLLLGLAGLGFELYNPGSVLPGLVGLLSLLAAIAGMTYLPVAGIGVALVLLGVALFVAETQVGGVGLLALAGVIAFALGGAFLFDSDDPGLEASPWIAVAVAVVVGGAFLASARLVRRARRAPVATGRGAMIGQVGVARQPLGAEPGHVSVNGEIWSARTADGAPVPEGSEVRVVRVHPEDLSLTVEPREG